MKEVYYYENESEDYIDEIIEHIEEYEFQNINSIDLENLYNDYEEELKRTNIYKT